MIALLKEESKDYSKSIIMNLDFFFPVKGQRELEVITSLECVVKPLTLL